MLSSIRILFANDHPLMREGMNHAIRRDPEMVLFAEASTGFEAVAAYRQHRPDVTLMDLQMPEMDGVTATQAIIKEFPHARIILVATSPGDIQARRALKAGARGYVLKGMIANDLLITIRRVHEGFQAISAEIAQEIAAHVGEWKSLSALA